MSHSIHTTIAIMPEKTQASLSQPSLCLLGHSDFYFHDQYLPDSPGADFILASSDPHQCWFAVDSQKFFGSSWNMFNKVHDDQSKPESYKGLPILYLTERRAVLQNIVLSMDPEAMPDFGQVDFEAIVATLEIAVDKYNLPTLEKLCLLALSLHAETYPIEVFTLALLYSADWLAKLSSPHTLKYDLEDVRWQDVLSQESLASLLELHTHRIWATKDIIVSQPAPTCSTCKCESLREFWCIQSTALVNRITRPDANLVQLFRQIVLRPAFHQITCPTCLDRLMELGETIETKWTSVRRCTL